MGKALDRLLELLDLEQIEVNIFRGRSPEERVQRVFGGQVAGQALVAAGRPPPAAAARVVGSSGSAAARWPGRPWSRPAGPCPRTARCTRCTPTSSGLAIR